MYRIYWWDVGKLMSYITGIWVSQDGFIHDVIGSVVKFVTGGDYAHNAIGIYLPEYNDDVIIEAIAPKVTVQAKDKYVDEFDIFTLQIPFTEEKFFEAQEYARYLISQNIKYGLFTDCIAGLLSTKVSFEAANWWADKYSRNTMDCSEVFANFIRIQYPDYMEGYMADTITPEQNLNGWLSYQSALNGE